MICDGKEGYANQGEARRRLGERQARARKPHAHKSRKHATGTLHPYKCECGKWHLGGAKGK